MVPLIAAVRIHITEAGLDSFANDPLGTLAGGIGAVVVLLVLARIGPGRLLKALLVLPLVLLALPFLVIGSLIDRLRHDAPAVDKPRILDTQTPWN